MKKYTFALLLLLFVPSVRAEVVVDLENGTITGSGTYADAIALTRDTTVTPDEGGITFSGAITGDFTLVKAGAYQVDMTNIACGGVNLTIDAGTVRLSSDGVTGESTFFPGKIVTVNAGGVLDLGVHDALGYKNLEANQFTININGGEVRNTVRNDSILRVDINMTGGLLSATTGMYDILSKTVHFNILAADGASAENPTVSTISGPLDLRNSDGLLPMNVAENARLDVTGRVLYYTNVTAGFEKSGAGTMVLSNTGNTFRGAASVLAGTLTVLGDSLKTSSGVTVASGATLCIGGRNAENVATAGTVGSPVTSSGTIRFGAGGSTLSGALTLAADTTVNAESGISGTLSGGTSGDFTLTKTGAGTLNLSGAQTQAATVVQAGTLNFAGAGSMSGTLTLADGAVLTKSGAGTFILPTSFVPASNDVTITGGALQFTTEQVAMLGTVSVGANGEFDVNVASDSYMFNKAFQGYDGGVGALGKSGAGTMVISDATILPTGAKFNVHAGTLQFGTETDSIAFSNAAAVDGGASLVLYVNSDTSYGQIISGAGNVVKRGDGTWTLTARQTFTGGLTVETGSVVLKGGNNGANGTLASASTATVKYGASLALGCNDALCWRAGNPAMITLEGGTFTTTAGSFHNSVGKFTLQSGTITSADTGDGISYIVDGTIKVLADVDYDGDGTKETSKITAKGAVQLRTDGTYIGGGFDVDEGGTLEVSSKITGTGLTKSGLGTMILTNSANAYTTTAIAGGTLKLSGAGKLGSGAVTLADGAVLELATTTAVGNAISSAGTLNFTANNTLSGALTLTGNTTINTASDVTAALTGGTSGDFTLTKTGAGTLNLSGAQTQAATVVQAGTLNFAGAGSMSGTLTLADGTALTKSGAGTFILPTSFVPTGNDVTITGGALQFTSGQVATLGTVSVGANGEFDVNVASDSYTFSKAFQGYDGGVGALGKSGAGTMVINDTSFLPTGVKFNVHAGTLQFGDGATTFALNCDTNIDTGADVTYFVANGDTNTFTKTLTGAGTFTKTGAGKLRIEGTTTQIYEPNIVVEAGTLELGTTRGNVRSFNHVTVKPGATLLCAAHDSLGYPVTGAMVIDLEESTLDNAKQNETLLATTLNMTGATVTSSGGGQYDILGSSVRFNVLAADGATAENPTVTNVTSKLKLRSDDYWMTPSGFIIDVAENAQMNLSNNIVENDGVARGFTKTGAGVLVLSGASTFTGEVLVNEGTLRLTGSLNSVADVIVAAGATLEGNGTLRKLALAGQQHLVFTLQPDGTVTTAGTLHATGNIELLNDVPFVVTSDSILNWEQYSAQEPVVLLTTTDDILGDAIEKVDFGSLSGNVPDVWLEAVRHTDGTNTYYTAEVRVPEPSAWLLFLLTCGVLLAGGACSPLSRGFRC